MDEYYAATYRAKWNTTNYDVYFGSGWGPDYGDPLTYEETLAPGGYMLKNWGINTSMDAEATAVYKQYFGQQAIDLFEDAKNEMDLSARTVKFAKYEAYLLDQAILLPNSTQGGNYAVSAVVPRTIPYTLSGTDNSKFKGMLVADRLLTKAERDQIIAEWKVERPHPKKCVLLV